MSWIGFRFGGASRLLFFLGLVGGCEVPFRSEPPLRPLVYTENPDITPEGVAIRESRLLRKLASGSTDGRWGDIQVQEIEFPPLETPEAFGQALANALLQRSRNHWEFLFVQPEEYSGMVHMPIDRSRAWVDDLQAQSQDLWQRFEPPAVSDSRPGGWAAVFEFHAIVTGEGRSVDGKLAKTPEDIAQYWNVLLKLKFLPRDAIVDIRLPKVLVIRNEFGVVHRLAAAPASEALLNTLFDAGLHLRPELLSPNEYPYPLRVGAFWRYRRESANQADQIVLQEVVAVDHLNGVLLAQIRESLSGQDTTSRDTFWALTPTRIFPCDASCRRNLEDTSWTLRYFHNTTPEFRFPLRSEEWGSFQGAPAHQVRPAGEVDVPGGLFPQTFEIIRRGSCTITERFVWRKGVVTREKSCSGSSEKDILLEYRLPT